MGLGNAASRWHESLPRLRLRTRCLAPGCMPRTDVMRTLLEQSEGVDNELATEGQERPMHLRSAVELRKDAWPSRKSHLLVGCFVCSGGWPARGFSTLLHRDLLSSMSMCTFPYAIVNALFLLAGSSALAPPLGGERRGARFGFGASGEGGRRMGSVGRLRVGAAHPQMPLLGERSPFVVQASDSSFPRRFHTRPLRRPPPHR